MTTRSESLLLDQVSSLRDSPVKIEVDARLRDFKAFKNRPENVWFSELCFCILTANSKARTAIAIQEDLGPIGFCECAASDLTKCIRKHKHRFHNTKTKYIMEARSISSLKKTIQRLIKEGKEPAAREWLVKNVKGIGYKESSHFLRNVGFENVAILDRHILNLMHEHRIIRRPQTLNRKRYIYYEKIFMRLAENLKMTPVELDIYMWYLKTGAVLK